MKTIKGYKGFNKDMKCRDFQFEAGKEYKHEGEVKVCDSGFHFCEHPLDVFGYYAPSDSRYAEVVGEGKTDKGGDDSKVSCSSLKIGAEIPLNAYIKLAIDFVHSKVDKTIKQTITNGTASNTGDQSAASNTGYRSAASNTGNYSAASNTGDQSAASNTGYQGVASSLGIEGKAKGALGCFLVLAEWKEIKNEWHRMDVKTAKVDGKKIKADTWYSLVDGKFKGAK